MEQSSIIISVIDREHFKNEMSLKIRISRGIFFRKVCFTSLVLTVVLLFTAVCSNTAMAQKAISIDELSAQYKARQNSLLESFKMKDYKTSEKLVNELIALFNQLSEEDQEAYKDFQGGNYYNLTCIYSQQKQKKAAVDAFKKAVKYGYIDYSHAKIDTDLDNIRQEKQFITLMDSIREKFDYPYILRKAGKYQQTDTIGLPHFTYESATSSNLKQVKDFFKLDSIVGQGDEISKIINLLTWVHKNIRHDGNNTAVSELDAIDVYNYYKSTGKGVNCRDLAITLNEMYLAMGFKSRYVTCGSKDNSEVHVINSVYSNTLNKWLWIDPTCNAYWKDENGNLLSIEEVRERFIDDRPLILNDDANWNNEVEKNKENYLVEWMSKLLYWLECTANSSFNVESRYRNTNQTYIRLAPLDYELPKTRYKVSMTHDAAYFWEH